MEFKLKEYRARPFDLKGSWEIYQYNDEECDWEFLCEFTFIDEEDCANQYINACTELRALERNHV